MEKAAHIIRKLRNLPTLPLVIDNLTRVINNPQSCAKDLSEIITKDQALSARVLKIVNSSFYGFPQKIPTVSRAVVILGYNCVKNLALSSTIFNFLAENVGIKDFDINSLWNHSLRCAACSRLIASKILHQDSEDTFISGLMHDIGKVIFIEYLADQYQQALSKARDDTVPICEAERLVIGIDHAELGYMLADKWKLHRVLSNSIRFHHRPLSAQKSCDELSLKIYSIVYLANILSKIDCKDISEEDPLKDIDPEVMNLLNIERGWEQRILLELEDEMEKCKVFVEGKSDNQEERLSDV
jgi:HD-like signal output (HDOD) protein